MTCVQSAVSKQSNHNHLLLVLMFNCCSHVNNAKPPVLLSFQWSPQYNNVHNFSLMHSLFQNTELIAYQTLLTEYTNWQTPPPYGDDDNDGIRVGESEVICFILS